MRYRERVDDPTGAGAARAGWGDAHLAHDEAISARMMRLVLQRVGTAVVVSVDGEIDALTVPRLTRAIDAARGGVDGTCDVVVDLTGVEFLGSAGIAALAGAMSAAARNGGSLQVVTGTNAVVVRPLRITGMHTVLVLREHLVDALDAVESKG